MPGIPYMCSLKYAHEQQYTSANTNIVTAGIVLAFTDDQEPEELYFPIKTSLQQKKENLANV